MSCEYSKSIRLINAHCEDRERKEFLMTWGDFEKIWRNLEICYILKCLHTKNTAEANNLLRTMCGRTTKKVRTLKG